jgi:hypothetical protein
MQALYLTASADRKCEHLEHCLGALDMEKVEILAELEKDCDEAEQNNLEN